MSDTEGFQSQSLVLQYSIGWGLCTGDFSGMAHKSQAASQQQSNDVSREDANVMHAVAAQHFLALDVILKYIIVHDELEF